MNSEKFYNFIIIKNYYYLLFYYLSILLFLITMKNVNYSWTYSLLFSNASLLPVVVTSSNAATTCSLKHCSLYKTECFLSHAQGRELWLATKIWIIRENSHMQTAISTQRLRFCSLLQHQLNRDNEVNKSHFQAPGLLPVWQGSKTGWTKLSWSWARVAQNRI